MSPCYFPLSLRQYISCPVHLVALFIFIFIDIHGLYRLNPFPVTVINSLFFLMFELSQAGWWCPFKQAPTPYHFYPRPFGVVFCFCATCYTAGLSWIFLPQDMESATLQGALLRFNPNLGTRMLMCWGWVE